MASEPSLGEQGNLGWGQADFSRGKIGTKVPRPAPVLGMPGGLERPECFEREAVRGPCTRLPGGRVGALWTGRVVPCEQEGPPLENLAVASGQCPVPVTVTASPCPPLLVLPSWGALAVAPPGGLHSLPCRLSCSRRSARWPAWTSAARWRWCGLTTQRPSSCPR